MAKKSKLKSLDATPVRHRRTAVTSGDMSPNLDMPRAGDMSPAEDMATSNAARDADQTKAEELWRQAPTYPASGLLDIALAHLGETYVLGARAPMANVGWKGPWDCAEFVSWCHYQYAKILFGTRPTNDPMRADAYTGYWADQATIMRCAIPWEEAASIPGAVILRKPATGINGHIVFSDGLGGTIEAHSARRGVTRAQVSGRRWDCGILVPGIEYFRADTALPIQQPPTFVLRVTEPLMQGPNVTKVQTRLQALGFPVGAIDGKYGPQTAYAVELFQAAEGLVADGEVGDETRKALFG